MLQVVNACSGDNCPKKEKCGRYISNIKHKGKLFTMVDNYANMGSTTSYYDQGSGETKYESNWYCGINGDFAMFEENIDIFNDDNISSDEKQLKDITLGEFKEICLRHQKQGCDCETCKVFKFCNYQLTGYAYPSGWDFGDKKVKL